jgi:hypothetical protein
MVRKRVGFDVWNGSNWLRSTSTDMSLLILCSCWFSPMLVLGVVYIHYPISSRHKMDHFVSAETSLTIKTSAVYHSSRGCDLRICVRWSLGTVYNRGGQNHRRQFAVAIKFCAVATDICGSSVWNLVHVAILALRILRWLLDFWKICVPLVYNVCRYAPHNDVSVNDGPHIWRWSHKIMI